MKKKKQVSCAVFALGAGMYLLCAGYVFVHKHGCQLAPTLDALLTYAGMAAACWLFFSFLNIATAPYKNVAERSQESDYREAGNEVQEVGDEGKYRYSSK